MDDLDAMLDDTAAEMLPKVFDLDAALKEKNLMNDVKPWLAFSSNVPASKRDEWSKMVKVDALAQLPVSCGASNAYYSWEKPGSAPVFGGERLLQEVLRSAASAAGIDDAKQTQLAAMGNPIIDTEGAKGLQKQFRAQILKDLTPVIKKDINYSPEAYPNLARAIE